LIELRQVAFTDELVDTSIPDDFLKAELGFVGPVRSRGEPYDDVGPDNVV